MAEGAEGTDLRRSTRYGGGLLASYLDPLPLAVELRDEDGRPVHANPGAVALRADLQRSVDEGPDGDPTGRDPVGWDGPVGSEDRLVEEPDTSAATPWGPLDLVDLVDPEGTPLSLADLPTTACLADGEPHSAIVGVGAEGADTAAGDVLAHRWFQVSAAPAPLPDGGRGVLVTYLDVTAERHLEERLRMAALHDPLTGLPNRRLLAVRFSQAQASAARAGNHIGLVYLDLDRFKGVNDVHGHGAGDRFLREFATRLQGITRGADTAARVGGDEFVVLCTHLDSALSLQTAASRIANAVDGTVVLDGRRATVGASVGWVLVGRDMDLDTALNQADTAMYRDKARRSAT